MRAGEEKEAQCEVAIRLTPRQPQPATFSARNLLSRHNGCMKEPNHHPVRTYVHCSVPSLEVGWQHGAADICFMTRRVTGNNQERR